MIDFLLSFKFYKVNTKIRFELFVFILQKFLQIKYDPSLSMVTIETNVSKSWNVKSDTLMFLKMSIIKRFYYIIIFNWPWWYLWSPKISHSLDFKPRRKKIKNYVRTLKRYIGEDRSGCKGMEETGN